MHPFCERNHRFITLSSPYSQSFMVCNENLRFPSWIQSKCFDWWSPEIVGILLFQMNPLFSYPAYAAPGGSSQQRSRSEGLHTLHELHHWSSTAQVQFPSDQSAGVLCLPEHMQRSLWEVFSTWGKVYLTLYSLFKWTSNFYCRNLRDLGSVCMCT